MHARVNDAGTICVCAMLVLIACDPGARPVVPCASDEDCAVGFRCADTGECVERGPSFDGGPAPVDAARPPDAPPVCEIARCTMPEECPLRVCLPERSESLNGALPIAGLAEGSLSVTLTPGGLCAATSEACDVESGALGLPDRCGECARCVPTAAGPECRPRCTGDDCGEGYVCDPLLGACVEACASDVECRISRVDRGHAGIREGPGVDRLEHDVDSLASCVEGRCVRPGRDGVRAGDPCARDDECGSGQRCIAPHRGWDDPSFPYCAGLDCERFAGGYCARLGCDAPGASCAEGEVCIRSARGIEGESAIAFCARECTVAAEPEAERVGPNGHGAGCEPGHACVPERDEIDGEPVGACLPGNYNENEPNVGAACTGASACWSPYGLGACRSLGWSGPDAPLLGACTVLACDRLPEGSCGRDADCQRIGASDLHACVRRCASASECAPMHACVDVDADARTPDACAAVCGHDDHCQSGERCSFGRCMAAGTCEEPIALLGVALARDGALAANPCPLQMPISEMCTWGLGPSYSFTTPSVGRVETLLTYDRGILLQSPRIRTRCAPESCPEGSGIGIRAARFEADKDVIVTPLIAMSGEGCGSSRASDLMFRFQPELTLGEPCDPWETTGYCAEPLVCADVSSGGFVCAERPSCARPIPLHDPAFLREDGSSVYITSYRSISDPTCDRLLFAYTAPSDGVLRVRAANVMLDDIPGESYGIFFSGPAALAASIRLSASCPSGCLDTGLVPVGSARAAVPVVTGQTV